MSQLPILPSNMSVLDRLRESRREQAMQRFQRLLQDDPMVPKRPELEHHYDRLFHTVFERYDQDRRLSTVDYEKSIDLSKAAVGTALQDARIGEYLVIFVANHAIRAQELAQTIDPGTALREDSSLSWRNRCGRFMRRSDPLRDALLDGAQDVPMLAVPYERVERATKAVLHHLQSGNQVKSFAPMMRKYDLVERKLLNGDAMLYGAQLALHRNYPEVPKPHYPKAIDRKVIERHARIIEKSGSINVSRAYALVLSAIMEHRAVPMAKELMTECCYSSQLAQDGQSCETLVRQQFASLFSGQRERLVQMAKAIASSPVQDALLRDYDALCEGICRQVMRIYEHQKAEQATGREAGRRV